MRSPRAKQLLGGGTNHVSGDELPGEGAESPHTPFARHRPAAGPALSLRRWEQLWLAASECAANGFSMVGSCLGAVSTGTGALSKDSSWRGSLASNVVRCAGVIPATKSTMIRSGSSLSSSSLSPKSSPGGRFLARRALRSAYQERTGLAPDGDSHSTEDATPHLRARLHPTRGRAT